MAELSGTLNENPYISSFTSNTSNSSQPATSNSKAVLAALKALQDKIKRLEQERDEYKLKLDNVTQEKQEKEKRIEELSNQGKENGTRIDEAEKERQEAMGKAQSYMEESVEYRNKVEELEKSVKKEKKSREESEKKQAEAEEAIKEMTSINQQLVERLNRMASYQAPVLGSGENADGMMAPGGYSSGGTRTKKKKKGKKKKCSCGSADSIHSRMKRANNNADVPFLLGKSGNTFNVTGNAQKGLSYPSRSYNGNMYNQGNNHIRGGKLYGGGCEDDILSDIDPNQDVDEVMCQLREEYATLNEQYNHLSSSMSEREQLSSAEITARLRQIIDLMERKSKQMAYLQRYRAYMVEQLKEANTPPSVRGAGKRVKTLKLFEQLRRMHKKQ
eukprot:gb/GECH01012521.1/.p1 GENE.gb/GECH01012521.1/~~gb/GECH01012521.1/.p1  ORF type:complete len:388 (+),score=121.41 gb/GECH01012521.1/:1-1164(+)